MDSAQKALDALAVPPDRRWVPDTWCNDDGEWVARGPTRVNRMPTPILGESDDDYADRCLVATLARSDYRGKCEGCRLNMSRVERRAERRAELGADRRQVRNRSRRRRVARGGA